MTISAEVLDALILKLRGVVPKDVSSYGFRASGRFFQEFEAFKLPLITHLSNLAEQAILSDELSENISEEFIRGYLDGVLSMVIQIANINLVAHTETEG